MPPLPHSLPRICVALGFSSLEELSRAAEREYKDGNTFLEFRLDQLRSPQSGIELIQSFCIRFPDVQILATCRHRDNGGGFRGTVPAQIALLRGAASAGSIALDLEIESAEIAKAETAELRGSAPLIISYHNFAATPALDSVKRRLLRIPADAYKVATTIRKPADTLRLITFTRDNAESLPLIALGMSEAGLPTRVLGPGCGCLFTYAAPADTEGTAPGQISSKLMRGLYRSDKLTAQSRIYGIIADPISHTKSPLIHNRAFHSRRLDSVYLPFLVSSAHLREWMELATALPVAGFSVTIPHKQRIVRHLDVVEPLAKRIGAVNTVWRKGGKWRGTNTDVDGILKPLGRHLRLAHASVLIAGYGGAARAAAFALCDAGARVTVTGRDCKRAAMLARAVHAETLTLAQASSSRFDALINATPVGMFPHPSESLFAGTVPAQCVFDMVYHPHETELLKAARAQGCTVIYGIEMLLEQASRQFEIWTGESAPAAVMAAAIA